MMIEDRWYGGWELILTAVNKNYNQFLILMIMMMMMMMMMMMIVVINDEDGDDCR